MEIVTEKKPKKTSNKLKLKQAVDKQKIVF